MRDKVMTWAVNKAEKGGQVPMEVGGVARSRVAVGE